METEEQKRKIIKAIAAHLANVPTEEEDLLLKEWRAASEENEALFRRFAEEGFVGRKLERMAEADVKSAWYLMEKRVDRKRMEERRRRSRVYMSYAAVAAGILLVITLAYVLQPSVQKKEVIARQEINVSKEAHLVLGDGRIVKIDKNGNQAIDESGGVTIYKESNHLDYSRSNEGEDTIVVYNEMHTLNGMEYMMILADGTRVFLNAESKLRYPVRFHGERVVEFEGEGYFCVAKDSLHPFIVKTKGMDVRVLGTEFNVRAYDDENSFETTLVKGRVAVKSGEHEHEIVPGEQVVYERVSGLLNTREVDVSLYTAWHHAEIKFKDTSMERVARNLARWYGVKFEFLDEESKRVELGGCINRYENIAPILDMLRRTELVNVVLENNTVYVSIKK